jgi:sugar lactone lactonase YvrE
LKPSWLAATVLTAASLLPGETVAQWREIQAAARAAHQAKNYPLFRDNLLKLREVLRGHPRVTYNLAAAEALTGNEKAALDWLKTYASMGFVWDIAADPDFAAIKGSAGFADILHRMDENRKPVSAGTTAFTLPEKDMLAEDLTYDPKTKTFYVSSVHHRKIVAVDSRGGVRDFIREGQDGIWGILAVSVDAKRRVLWASTAAMAQVSGYREGDKGRSAVLKYDLATGRLIQRYDLAGEGAGHVLGDMTVSPDGDVYVSDGISAGVYTIRHDRDQLEILAGPENLASPQTPALSPDGKRLFVADYSHGIAIIDLATRGVSWLQGPDDFSPAAIDGLCLSGRTLIAVQNGTSPIRIISIRLDPTLRRAESWQVIEANTAALGTPTHAIAVGRELYFIGHSGWDNFTDEGPVKPGAIFESPRILKTRLP